MPNHSDSIDEEGEDKGGQSPIGLSYAPLQKPGQSRLRKYLRRAILGTALTVGMVTTKTVCNTITWNRLPADDQFKVMFFVELSKLDPRSKKIFDRYTEEELALMIARDPEKLKRVRKTMDDMERRLELEVSNVELADSLSDMIAPTSQSTTTSAPADDREKFQEAERYKNSQSTTQPTSQSFTKPETHREAAASQSTTQRGV